MLPVPDTSVSSVQHQYYRHRTLRYVRNINTGNGHFGKFGTTSIPVPETSVSSVRWQKYTAGTGMEVCTGAGTKNYLRRTLIFFVLFFG